MAYNNCCDLPDADQLGTNLKERFFQNKIYTYIANVLVAVNPNKSIPELYSEQVIQKYKDTQQGALDPHVFAIAQQALNHLQTHKNSQSIIIAGESGSGKTETTKHLLRFLSKSPQIIGHSIDRTNQLLEAFGNSKTPENHNSSRFIKSVQVNFDSSFNVSGIATSYFFLEKSRLIAHGCENNFHIFYLLVAGASETLQCKLHLKPHEFVCLSNWNTIGSTQRNKLREDFLAIDDTLRSFGTSCDTNLKIYELLAAILHLGNIGFEDSDDTCGILASTEIHLKIGANLLGIEASELKDAFLNRRIGITSEGRSSEIIMPLSKFAARKARDTFVKKIYNRLFDFVFNLVNKGTSSCSYNSHIAILDIAGFEGLVKSINLFEQFCINYINEKLQQFCTKKLIKNELQWYESEGINIPPISFLDNIEILDLYNETFVMLDDETKTKNPSLDNFNLKLQTFGSKHSAFDLPKLTSSIYSSSQKYCFVIRHFAGNVCYSAENFIETNTERLPYPLNDLIKNSLLSLGLESTLPEKESKSVSTSLRMEVKKMIECLEKTGSHFIRCIKPNADQVPGVYDDAFVLQQLKSSSSIAFLRLMLQGYAKNIPLNDLLQNFNKILPNCDGSSKTAHLKHLLRSIGYAEKDFRIGQTNVFFRQGTLHLLDTLIRTDAENLSKVQQQLKRYQMKLKWRRAVFCTIFLLLLSKKSKTRPFVSDDTSPEPAKKARIAHEASKVQNSEVRAVTLDPEARKTFDPDLHEENDKMTEEIRLDGKNHLPIHDQKHSAGRCAFKCGQKTHWLCTKCRVHLCLTTKRNCFLEFHTNDNNKK